MDSPDILHLKQAITDKLRRNGTLDRIQAELRSAVFLAFERDNDNEGEEVAVDESKFDQTISNSIIYHFLRQNRFLATAAVFEKEMHQKIINLDELRQHDATRFCFQFTGNSISLTDLNSISGTKEHMKIHWNDIKCNERNNFNSNFISTFEMDDRKSNTDNVRRQQIGNHESNRTSTNFTSDNETHDMSTTRSGRNRKETQNDRTIEKANKDDAEQRSTTIFGQQQKQISNISSTTIYKDQQQSTKYMKSSYPRKLPPIKPTSNEPAQPTILPSISSNRTGIASFSRLLDTVLNSPPTKKSETDEDIEEEIIPDNLLQSDNDSGASITF